MATTKHLKAIIRLRRATENEWIEKNPILRLGEPAFSIDINKLKIGDGIHHWSQLEYLNAFDNDFILDCGTSTTNV